MVRRLARRLPFEVACLPRCWRRRGCCAGVTSSAASYSAFAAWRAAGRRPTCLPDGGRAAGHRGPERLGIHTAAGRLPASGRACTAGAQHEMLGGSRPRNLAPGSLHGAGWLGRALFAHAPRRRSGPSTSGARVDGARRVVCRARRGFDAGQVLNHIPPEGLAIPDWTWSSPSERWRRRRMPAVDYFARNLRNRSWLSASRLRARSDWSNR